ncbi:hypothetical protein AB6A40_008715 [Gnathostoma spinigerum]|uniref:DnaJ homolog subfamily C member 1 n=1 Tax=Gnathostoma spinigerum TaxID=75299 RepID=A0ABD6ERR1_9BILA
MGYYLLRVFAFALFCQSVYSWSTEELAMYDLVEEVEGSFYELFEIEKDANSSEVKKAYRRLSMKWHPDRNREEGAAEMFRKIAAVYEVLKSEELREKYDFTLEYGLPDWRQPIYYVRRARKLSWYETFLVLLLICSTGHYLMLWGSYFDKYLTLSSNSSKLRKKEVRQQRKAGLDAEELHEAKICEQLAEHRPTFRNLLPFLFISFFLQCVTAVPQIARQIIDDMQATKLKDEVNAEPVHHFMPSSPAQPVYEFELACDVKPVLLNELKPDEDNNDDHRKHENQSRGSAKPPSVWSREELVSLLRLSDKYPVGTPNRWALMAKVLQRTPEDVCKMVANLKRIKQDEFMRELSLAQNVTAVSTSSQPTSCSGSISCAKRDSLSEDDKDAATSQQVAEDWSQQDQRMFEIALQQFPKGSADRWDKIANCVPHKTKQQCIERFKELSEVVRLRKIQHKAKRSKETQ